MSQARDYQQPQLSENELLTVAAHELKSPLTTIKTLAQFLELNQTSPDTITKHIQRIAHTAQRGLLLVEAIMELEHLKMEGQALDVDPVNLLHVVNDVVHEIEPQVRERNQSIRVYERNLQPVYSDQRFVRQVIHNLVENASKYSDNGQPIEVRFRSVGPHQSVRVRDYGIGVTQEEWMRMCTKFGKLNQPLAANASSNGLGLYISKQLSEFLGGQLQLQTKRVGSCFVFELPMMQQQQLWQAGAW